MSHAESLKLSHLHSLTLICNVSINNIIRSVIVKFVEITQHVYLFPLTDPLSVDKHLKIVRKATWDVRVKWYNLGLQLGIDVGTLNVSSLNGY